MAIQMRRAGGDMARLASALSQMEQGEDDVEKLSRGMSRAGLKLVENDSGGTAKAGLDYIRPRAPGQQDGRYTLIRHTAAMSWAATTSMAIGR